MKSIEIKHISKSYGDITAIDDLSFEVNKGEIFGLIGPDGSGKTSIFRILTTVTLPDKGEAFVQGLNVRTDFKKIRKLIGYMPGRFSLYQDLTVEENLKFYSSVFNTSIADNYELIKDIYSQLEPFKDRRAGKLSGGMKQKLALSCALIHRPEVLFLDEPTTGVDAVSRKEFWEMLDRLRKTGITILVSTPYMDEAAKCDRIALIKDGKILNIDTPDNISSSFQRTLYAVRSADTHKLIKDLRDWNKTHSSFAFGDNIHLSLKDDYITEEDITAYISSKEHSDIFVKKILPGIEDTFIELLKQEDNHD
ncbi:MAG: ABC transporter ATP-binding protein [Candidatus Delongbacteria bacterium]|jgi:ABC-2 type transport system ATP-binding protein|nr:ABC transporter ATP-binding protein [Candidatus Delongbacteria bacterium]